MRGHPVSRATRARWVVARILGRLPGTCWAELATWALGPTYRPRLWETFRTGECKTDASRCGACYCGSIRKDGIR